MIEAADCQGYLHTCLFPAKPLRQTVVRLYVNIRPATTIIHIYTTRYFHINALILIITAQTQGFVQRTLHIIEDK